MSQLHAILLHRAGRLLGGPDEVARYLGVPDVRVRIWLRGLISPPDDVFLKLVDLLSDPPPPAAARPSASRRRA